MTRQEIIPPCTCFFCMNDRRHPSHHQEFFGISHHLLVPESLDEKDSVPLEACSLCGHVRVAEER